MAKGYSKDLRARAVALVEDGESRRETARVLGLGASTAIRWIERWTTTGSVAALPGTGHSRSPLEAHRQWLLAQSRSWRRMTCVERVLVCAMTQEANLSKSSSCSVTFRSRPPKSILAASNSFVMLSMIELASSRNRTKRGHFWFDGQFILNSTAT